MEPLRGLGAAEVTAVITTYRDALRLHQQAINRLNVYPVPDGDTGTNMSLTVESVVSELQGLDNPGMPEVCKALSHGSLMGARGNSGVILCQLLRGMSSALAGCDPSGPRELTVALRAASDAANGAVLRPVEGTILTVARAAAFGAEQALSSGSSLLGDVVDGARRNAADALERTPEMLPVLKQAGVVDAGGAGYLLLLDAMLNVIDGRPLPSAPEAGPMPQIGVSATADHASETPYPDDSSRDLRYEVMYLLEATDETMAAFKDVWAGIGDSIVVVGGEGLWNCHIHTDDVGSAIEAGIDAGRPRDIRVTDLAEQVEEERWVREGALSTTPERPAGPAPRTAVVAVANGDGIARIFRSLGVHDFVPGGQSMNPSTAQILGVVDASDSPEVVILPNNDNIHPVAMQVAELATKAVRVVPTSGIVEGFAALLEYDPQASADDNADSMAQSARRVVAGEVTQAVRDAAGPVGPIRKGEYLGLSRDGVESVASDLVQATCDLLGKLLSATHEIVTLIEGEGSGAGETRQIKQWLSEHRPDVSVEVHHGGQPLYPYLLSIE